MQREAKIVLWSLLLIIFLISTFIFTARTIHRYEIWKGHEDYLKSNNKTIEDWMPPNLIVKRIGISKELIYNELGVEETFSNNRRPLYEICQEKNLNCSLVVERFKLVALQGEKRK